MNTCPEEPRTSTTRPSTSSAGFRGLTRIESTTLQLQQVLFEQLTSTPLGSQQAPDLAAKFKALQRAGQEAKAAKARAYRGELILTYGNEAGTAWIANLIFSLRAAGIDHSLVIVMSDEHCKSLNRAPWMISCAWSSWDFGQSHTGGATTTKR